MRDRLQLWCRFPRKRKRLWLQNKTPLKRRNQRREAVDCGAVVEVADTGEGEKVDVLDPGADKRCTTICQLRRTRARQRSSQQIPT